MNRRTDAHIARSQLRQIAGPPPKWLVKAWAGAKRRGLEAITLDEINDEIAAARDDIASAPGSQQR